MSEDAIRENAPEDAIFYIQDSLYDVDYIKCENGNWYVWLEVWSYVNPITMSNNRHKLIRL